ncbi:MAG: EAL domain-containing protein, partial [Candidatus Competibacteraceae bacterium]|nr:EAL domain-containing protein [Candidatus Competibacteraceae bacterium]
LDIDDFTAIGITFGETFCNQLIIRLHEQLRAALTENTLIARIDRDALAILVGDDKPLDNLFFEHFLNQPLQIADGEHSISATVAVVDLQSLADLQAEQILRLAESMIETARHKKQHYTFYDTRLEHEIANRYSLLSELRSAVTQKKLYVELQPKVRLADGKLVGFEALARWQKANGQMIPPSQFIPLAETSGLIVKLDQLILQQTCQAIHTLQAAGINVPVAFNVSSFELLRPDYFSTL